MFDQKKYFLLGVAVAAAMSGCGGGDDNDTTTTETTTLVEHEPVAIGQQERPTEPEPVKLVPVPPEDRIPGPKAHPHNKGNGRG